MPPAPLHNLPPALTTFIGREPEIAAAVNLLGPVPRGGPLLTLTGVGGSGKTRLAREIGARLLDAFAGGVWLVEFAALADPRLVPQAVARVLGVGEQPGRPLLDTLQQTLRARPLLLILDNCEHLIGAVAALVDTLLRGCPQLRVLATSRERLRVNAEAVLRVPALALPAPGPSPSLAAIGACEAVQLFLLRAQALQPDFALTADNASDLWTICVQLDGMPLAIELAAGRIPMLSVAQIQARLPDRFRLLTGGSRAALPRQQTLRALVDWSYDLLTAPEQLLFLRLAAFSGGFSLDAAEAVCAHPPFAREDILPALGDLVDKSLVVKEEPGGSTRYRLLETLRQYAATRLTDDEAAPLRARHFDWTLALAEQAALELQGPQQKRWLDRLDLNVENLRAALGWAAGGPERTTAGLRLAVALRVFWLLRDYWSEGRRVLEALLEQAGDSPPDLRARALFAVGELALTQEDRPAAQTYYEECLTLRRALGDARWIASTLDTLGIVALNGDDYDRARTLLAESLTLYRRIGHRLDQAIPVFYLARTACRQGDYPQAAALLHEAHALTEAGGNDHWRAVLLFERAELLCDQGSYASAHTLFEQTLNMAEKLNDKRLVNCILCRLGHLAVCAGDHAQGRALYGQAQTLADARGSRGDRTLVLSGLARIAAAEGRYADAITGYVAGLELSYALGYQREVAELLEALAGPVGAQGWPRHAARLLGAAARLRAAIGAPRPPAGEPAYTATVAAAHAALGADGLAQELAVGGALDAAAALRLARDLGAADLDPTKPHISVAPLC